MYGAYSPKGAEAKRIEMRYSHETVENFLKLRKADLRTVHDIMDRFWQRASANQLITDEDLPHVFGDDADLIDEFATFTEID